MGTRRWESDKGALDPLRKKDRGALKLARGLMEMRHRGGGVYVREKTSGSAKGYPNATITINIINTTLKNICVQKMCTYAVGYYTRRGGRGKLRV